MQNYGCVAEQVYDTRDNVIDWVLLDDDEPITDLSAVTRMTFTVGEAVIDSAANPEAIWWTDQKDILWHGELITTDIVRMMLGGMGLVEGLYNGCSLVVFEPAKPGGTLWINDASIDVLPSG